MEQSSFHSIQRRYISFDHLTSASRLNLKFKILSRISTKIQLHNLYKTSATKYRPNSSFKFCLNFNFKILTKPCAQSLNKSLALWTILSYQICNKLLPIQSSSSTLATVTISTSFELVSSHARVTSIKFTKQEWVSQWVREGVTDKHNQWSDSGPIKRNLYSSDVARNVFHILTDVKLFRQKTIR